MQREFPPGEERLVLVVEDQADLRLMACLTLEVAGYTYLEAGNAAEAIARLQNDDPDCVVMDLGLPDADGLDLLERLRALDLVRGRPVIIMSADSSTATMARAGQLGAGFVRKPFAAQTLVSAVDAAFERGP